MDLVPKDPDENLRFRLAVIRDTDKDLKAQAQLRAMCREDCLFWINTFIFTFDPRKRGQSQLPFLTYEFQDRAITTIKECLGARDLRCEKTRDMGATWIMLCCFLHEWQFCDLSTFLLASRKEDAVDKAGDPDCLFWKLDYAIKHQPRWLLPNYKRSSMHLENVDTGSTIDGESTNNDLARGGRRTAIGLDEFAVVENAYHVVRSTRDVTACRIFNSTVYGEAGNAFADTRFLPNITNIRLHWSQHPEKCRGLYRCVEGEIQTLDKEYVFPKDYKFNQPWPDNTGKLRSPWYDEQCKRAVSPQEIAQELDIDYGASAAGFFDARIEALLKETVGFTCRGELEFDNDTLDPHGFAPRDNGCLYLWFNPELTAGKPPGVWKCVVGCDIAAGTGATNSVLSVGDALTGRKVAEYVTPTMLPHDLARVAVALCRWFKYTDEKKSETDNFRIVNESPVSYLIWESNGAGRIFGDGVINSGFRNIYYRQKHETLTKDRTNFPGFVSTKETKVPLLGEYRRALILGLFKNPCWNSLDECRNYIFAAGGTIEHASSVSVNDPSGAGENHADRVIADALLWKGMREIAPEKGAVDPKSDQEKETIPECCIYTRRRSRQIAVREAQFGGW